MIRPLRVLAVMLVLLVTSGVAISYAQEQVTFTTTFAFRLGKTVHPAGEYVVSVADDQRVLNITPQKGVANVAAIETRLAGPDPQTDAKIVFDKMGDVYYLSEVWIPGYDGFLLTATKQQHTHVKVKAVKKG